ncbi:hypothetical protein [Dethiosulfatarculus sandiegensis]|uniref:Uncharacterized protein n=1 Tax=Dethiosulfatarculus sandiegensis TaxID=1429043 RepID=A0A0D2HP88_9BACT|nr:hypothetical protein [Dethiosulfatarculus sandiegensis]KIX12338.1 hypothetical protein X474_20940 [Dethiosulfatarculus sandiegensis]
MRRKKKSKVQKWSPLPQEDMAKWMSHPGNQMITCPNQPGNLKISQSSCAKRYVAANEPRWANIGAEPFPIFVIKMNLIPCRNCKVGEAQARSLSERAA